MSSVPPVSRDALTHHLYVPKLYLRYGILSEIPGVQFSYFPMNLDLLYLIPLYYGNDIVPKYIHFVFALLTGLLIFEYLKPRLGITWALFGVLYFLSLPIIVKLSTTVYVDLGLVFFSMGAIFFLIRWGETGYRLRSLIIAGVFCGLALGTKYNGLIVWFLLSAAVPFLYLWGRRNRAGGEHPFGTTAPQASTSTASRWSQIRALNYGLLFAAIALVLFSPWLWRNYVWTQNPIYPLFNTWFNLEPIRATASWEALGPIGMRTMIFKESWWEIALIPLRIFFQGQDDNPQLFDGRLNPFLLLLPIIVGLRFRWQQKAIRKEIVFLATFAVLFMLTVFFRVDMRIRYVAPMIAPLVIIATFGLHEIHRWLGERQGNHAGKIAQFSVATVAIVLLLLNGIYVYQLAQKVAPLEYLRGEISRNDYIERHRPEYAAINFANERLEGRIKILGLFMGNRGYYHEHPIVFDLLAFRDVVEQSLKSEAILRALKEKGITHLLIQTRLFNPWVQQNFKADTFTILTDFFARQVKPLHSKNGYALMALN